MTGIFCLGIIFTDSSLIVSGVRGLARKMVSICWVALLMGLISACDSASPGVREIGIQIHRGLGTTVSMEPSLIETKHNDTLILNVASHQKGMIHIHGYDLGIMVAPDSIVVLEFDAVTTGRFEIMFHAVVLPAVGSENAQHADHHASHASNGGDGSVVSGEDDHHAQKDGQSADQFLGHLQVMPR